MQSIKMMATLSDNNSIWMIQSANEQPSIKSLLPTAIHDLPEEQTLSLELPTEELLA